MGPLGTGTARRDSSFGHTSPSSAEYSGTPFVTVTDSTGGCTISGAGPDSHVLPPSTCTQPLEVGAMPIVPGKHVTS